MMAGEAVILSDEELALRSVYMRLYRARCEGRSYEVRFIPDAVLLDLFAAGHVVECDADRVAMTYEGLRAWAWLNRDQLSTGYMRSVKVFRELADIVDELLAEEQSA